MKKWLKDRKNYLRTDAVLFIINVILIANIGVIFSKYVNNNQKEIHDISMQGITQDSAGISRQLYHYMLRQQDVIVNAAAYIEAAELTYDETLLYLGHMYSVDGSLAIIDCETCEGYRVSSFSEAGVPETPSEEMRKKLVNYTDNASIENICTEILEGESNDNKLKVSDVFEGTEPESEEVAFYQAVTIDGEQKVLLYILSIDDVVEEGLIDPVSGNKLGILIDKEGTILGKATKFFAKDEKIDNYYDYIEESFGKGQREAVKNKLNTADSGNFTLFENNGEEWVYAYAKIEETPDWVYLYRQANLGMGLSTSSRNAIIQVIIFMTLIAGTDIAVIFWQNMRLKRNLVELKRANQAKDDFISNMSHEIRTPINAVLGMDEMIIRESTEDAIVQYAYDIKNAGRTLLGLINDILDFSKIESGKMEIIPAEYEISSVVNDLVNMIDAKAKAKKLEFKVNVNSTMPRMLFGDELRIKQVILNILTNAVKYTEAGKVSFQMDYEKLDAERILLKVSVKDTGIGLKPEEKDKLFKPFERIDEKRNRNIEGTGLGMSIVIKLLEQMGSVLEVESVYGEGSDFHFVIEQRVVDWTEMGNVEQAYRDARDSEKEKQGIFRAPKARILVVDDTPVNLSVVRGLLKRTGIIVETAGSGKECLERASIKKYDVILLDHRMPEMDGIETIHRLKQMEGTNKETSVIALTANAVSGAYEVYLREGFCDYLPKPVSGTKLERMLMKYLPKELVEMEEVREETPEEIEKDVEETGLLKYQNAPELDVREGIRVCSSEEIYCEVLKDFSTTAESRIKEIEGYYDNGDIRNYMIKVHALKSSARLAGAMQLSEKAKYLEQCANEGNIEEIEAETQDLLTNYREVGIKILGMLDVKDAAEKEEIDEKRLEEAFIAVKEFNEAFDFDNVDAVMKSLSDCRMPQKALETYKELEEAVMDVDQERIRIIIDTYLGGAEIE